MLGLCFRLLADPKNSDSVTNTAAATVRQVLHTWPSCAECLTCTSRPSTFTTHAASGAEADMVAGTTATASTHFLLGTVGTCRLQFGHHLCLAYTAALHAPRQALIGGASGRGAGVRARHGRRAAKAAQGRSSVDESTRRRRTYTAPLGPAGRAWSGQCGTQAAR